jgi:hypothetical protein
MVRMMNGKCIWGVICASATVTVVGMLGSLRGYPTLAAGASDAAVESPGPGRGNTAVTNQPHSALAKYGEVPLSILKVGWCVPSPETPLIIPITALLPHE